VTLQQLADRFPLKPLFDIPTYLYPNWMHGTCRTQLAATAVQCANVYRRGTLDCRDDIEERELSGWPHQTIPTLDTAYGLNIASTNKFLQDFGKIMFWDEHLPGYLTYHGPLPLFLCKIEHAAYCVVGFSRDQHVNLTTSKLSSEHNRAGQYTICIRNALNWTFIVVFIILAALCQDCFSFGQVS
jgi:hypothetical protein